MQSPQIHKMTKNDKHAETFVVKHQWATMLFYTSVCDKQTSDFTKEAIFGCFGVYSKDSYIPCNFLLTAVSGETKKEKITVFSDCSRETTINKFHFPVLDARFLQKKSVVSGSLCVCVCVCVCVHACVCVHVVIVDVLLGGGGGLFCCYFHKINFHGKNG